VLIDEKYPNGSNAKPADDVKRTGLVKRTASFPARAHHAKPKFWNGFAIIMTISLFYASILHILEICLDIMRHLGKIYSAGEIPTGSGGLVSRRAEKPGLEVVRQKGRA
jgi:hypothetical protein